MSRRGFAHGDNSSDQVRIARLCGEIAKLKEDLCVMKKLNAMNNERAKQAYSIVEDMRKEVEVYKARNSQPFESVSLGYHIMNFFGDMWQIWDDLLISRTFQFIY